MARAERKALFRSILNDWQNADPADVGALRSRLEEAGLLVYVDHASAALDAISAGAIFVRVKVEEDDASRNSAVAEFVRNLYTPPDFDQKQSPDEDNDSLDHWHFGATVIEETDPAWYEHGKPAITIYDDGHIVFHGSPGTNTALSLLREARRKVKEFAGYRALPTTLPDVDDIPF